MDPNSKYLKKNASIYAMDEKGDFVKKQIQFYIYIVYLKLKTSIPH